MQGKHVLITGATSGIGQAAAKVLKEKGATVIALGRDAGKLEGLRRDLKVETIQADLSVQAEVRRAAAEYKQRFARLDVLLNNAGAIFPDRQETKDGHERTFAVNHLAYFLLTNELLPLLKASAPARIINVASDASKAAPVDLNDLENRNFKSIRAYARSKRMNLLFTFELARRLEGTGVTVNALHPGVIKSGFGAGAGLMGFFVKLAGPFLLTPEQGAQTSIFLASSPDVAGTTGKYFAKSREQRAPEQAYDPAVQRGLWEASEKLTAPAA